MKSIANQYRDLKEGRMSQSNFMRNLRMMVPQYITNVTSFNDAVRILKNKSILTEYSDPKEKHYEGGISEDYDTLDAADSAAEKLAISMGSYEDAIVALEDEMGLSHSAADAIASRVYPKDEDGEIEDLINKYAEEESGKYTTGEDQFEINEESVEKFGALSQEQGEKGSYIEFEISNVDDDSFTIIYKITPNSKFSRNPRSEGSVRLPKQTDPRFREYIKVEGMKYGPIGKKAISKIYGEDLNEAKKKKEAKAELHPNQVHPQELRMGIKVELEHTDDLDKAKKIALDHLAENPFYYTALKLSGIESPSAPKVKAPEEKKARKKKEAVELVDKANQMVKVKDTKKKLNEAGGEFMFSGILNNVEAEELRKIIPGVEIEELKDTYKTVISHPTYNEKSLRHAVKQAMGQLPPVGDKKDLGASFDKFKSSLEEVVREVIAEYYDGHDNLDAENEY